MKLYGQVRRFIVETSLLSRRVSVLWKLPESRAPLALGHPAPTLARASRKGELGMAQRRQASTSRFQLLLQFIQEPPVGALNNEFVGGRFEHSNFV